MRYSYAIVKSKDYRVNSNEFLNIVGSGLTEDYAFNSFITSAFNYIKNCLKNDISVPEEYLGDRAGSKTFGLPLNMALKIKLHNIRLKKQVTKTELANFLSFSTIDLPEGIWNVGILRSLTPNKTPKYKKVQRLFDISHESTVREIEHAYRVLGYNVEITPHERKD